MFSVPRYELSYKHKYTLWRNVKFHTPIYSNIYPTRCNFTQFSYIWKMLYTFRVVNPPIIRSAYNCICNIRYLSDRYCYLPLAAGSSKLHFAGYILEYIYDARTHKR
jgi:hypothetical protein